MEQMKQMKQVDQAMQADQTDQNRLFAALTGTLPSDVERMFQAGHFADAEKRIDTLLRGDLHPASLRDALLALQQIMRRLPLDFSLTREAALQKIRAEIPDFREEEWDRLVADGRINWRYIEGEVRYLNSCIGSLRLYPDMNARGLAAEPGEDIRDRVTAGMRRYGRLTARISMEAGVAPSEALLTDPDQTFEAWIPVPAACTGQSDIRIEIPDALLQRGVSVQIAPADAPARTVYMKGRAGCAPFYVTYHYTQQALYQDLYGGAAPLAPVPHPASDALDAPPCDADLAEDVPHIMFSPYMRSLCDEILADCPDAPLARARAIYDYITTHISYRYQPDYANMLRIAETAAANGFADCGVFSLVFITLCRIAGIPARWQSGLYVKPDGAGPHDWSQFYIDGYGWLWADCSFGSGANRMGDETRRRHYFGNLDPLRMTANRAYFAQLTPPHLAWRHDPYDNQVGEAMLGVRPLFLPGQELRTFRRLLSFTFEEEI